MNVAIPKEIENLEKRVAATPETVKKMTAMKLSVSVEQGAGIASGILDADYKAAGAAVVADKAKLLSEADIVLKVRPPVKDPRSNLHEADLLKHESILIGLFGRTLEPELLSKVNDRRVSVFSLDALPRLARTQKMDALSSQSNLSGYKAVLTAADRLHKMMPLMMTAAGTITPAKVFIIGAGVAGLQAIATAKRLGALVEAFDTRPVVKEQVESLGAKFVEIPIADENTEDQGGYAKELSEDAHRKEQELITQHVCESDIVITTALIPGKPAPLLITKEAVAGMKPGSVIVDLAAETGGNCALTQKGKEITENGVTIIGYLNYPSRTAIHASQLYAKNVLNFLSEILRDGKIELKMDDPVCHDTLLNPQVKSAER